MVKKKEHNIVTVVKIESALLNKFFILKYTPKILVEELIIKVILFYVI